MSRNERARTYRRRAEEMRRGAEATSEIAAQDVMLRLAAKYDALAGKLEMRPHPSAGYLAHGVEVLGTGDVAAPDWNRGLASALSSH